MKTTLTLVAILGLASVASGFVIAPPPNMQQLLPRPTTTTALYLSEEAGERPKSSRIEGNQRSPTEDEMQLMDEMIDKLAAAKPYELPNAVRRAFRVISSPVFFMRIAERSDAASDEVQKAKLSALATNLVSTLEAVVSTAEETLEERAKEVETVVKAAAEPDSGEFLVPLLPERVQAMRSAFKSIDASSLDEGFLSTVDAWMMKSHQDGMDLMVGILQKVLQMYAGIQILRARQNSAETTTSSPATKLLERLLETEPDAWDAEIQGGLDKDSLTASELQTEVQRTMESIVLGLDAGSMAQRVQAEYLQELVKRVEQYLWS